MNRVDKIRKHPVFQDQLAAIAADEERRIFCGHDMQHLLDVARIMTIMAGPDGPDREIIYAAALLHDIGRHLQYSQGIPHHEGSADLAEEVLHDCDFSQDEIAVITNAIRGHRSPSEADPQSLAALLYKADKKSRPCYACPARSECNWPEEKMNLSIEV